MRKLIWCSLAVVGASLGWLCCHCYHHPDSSVSQYTARITSLCNQHNPLAMLVQQAAGQVHKEEEACSQAVEANHEEGVPDEPVPVEPEPKQLTGALDLNPVMRGPGPIVIREDEEPAAPAGDPMAEVVGVPIFQEEVSGQVASKVEAEPIHAPRVMPYCPADQDVKEMPYVPSEEPAKPAKPSSLGKAIESFLKIAQSPEIQQTGHSEECEPADDGKPGSLPESEEPAKAEELKDSEPVGYHYPQSYSEPADLGKPGDGVEGEPSVKAEEPGGLDEDCIRYHHQYSVCPYTGQSYLNDDSTDMELIPMPSSVNPEAKEKCHGHKGKKGKHKTHKIDCKTGSAPIIPDVNTMEFRPSDRTLEEIAGGGPY